MSQHRENTAAASLWDLSSLSPAKGSRHRRKRLGFGEASGKGKTCGKGTKGHKSRSGHTMTRGFEGGQMPLHRRLPKIGFASRSKLTGAGVFEIVSISQLSAADCSGEFTLDKLIELGLIRGRDSKVKILGARVGGATGGEVTRHIVVHAHAASASARAAIEKAGGEVRIVEHKSPEKRS